MSHGGIRFRIFWFYFFRSGVCVYFSHLLNIVDGTVVIVFQDQFKIIPGTVCVSTTFAHIPAETSACCSLKGQADILK